MKLALTLFALSALLQVAACSIPAHMSNDDIIRETKQCHNAHMDAGQITDAFGLVQDIQCIPKESP